MWVLLDAFRTLLYAGLPPLKSRGDAYPVHLSLLVYILFLGFFCGVELTNIFRLLWLSFYPFGLSPSIKIQVLTDHFERIFTTTRVAIDLALFVL